MIVMMTRVMTATKTAVDVDSIENEKNMRWLAQRGVCHNPHEVVVTIYNEVVVIIFNMRWLSQSTV